MKKMGGGLRGGELCTKASCKRSGGKVQRANKCVPGGRLFAHTCEWARVRVGEACK